MIKVIFQVAFLLILASPTLAQDWVATRVRGVAEHHSGGQWIKLTRGAVVEDTQRLRTGADGRVTLTRGAELIELDPGTQILLQDGVGKMTSVIQSSGTVSVDVERRNVQHFSVQTPFLAAVVKGTRFRVTVTPGSASVAVERGTVQVQDTQNDLVTDIGRGQQAEVTSDTPLVVAGNGAIGVFTFDGQPVVNGTANAAAGPALPQSAAAQAKANAEAAKNGNGNGGNNGNGGSNGNAGGNGNGNGNAGGNRNGDGHVNGQSGGNGLALGLGDKGRGNN